MDRASFSHTKSVTANVSNLKERNELDKISNYYDKCREKVESDYAHEKKDLRRQLVRLNQEKQNLSSTTIGTPTTPRGSSVKISIPSDSSGRDSSGTESGHGSSEPPRGPNIRRLSLDVRPQLDRHVPDTRRHSFHVDAIKHDFRRKSIYGQDRNQAPSPHRDGSMQQVGKPKPKDYITLSMTGNLAQQPPSIWQDRIRREHFDARGQNDHLSVTGSRQRIFPDLRHNSFTHMPPHKPQSGQKAPHPPSPLSNKRHSTSKHVNKPSFSEHYVHGLSERELSQYQKLMENACAQGGKSGACPVLPRVYGAVCTGNQRYRKKMLAFELLLRQMSRMPPKEHDFDPVEMLACRYLRLSNNNVETLTQMCRDAGADVSIHPHMKPEDISKIIRN